MVIKEPLLHPVVGANGLENIPGKDLVELPGDEAHGNSAGRKDTGNGNEERPHIFPHILATTDQRAGRFHFLHSDLNLLDLDGGVDHDGEVGNAHADDLNGVLHTEGIPDNDDFVQKGKDEESEEGGNGPPLRFGLGPLFVAE